MYYGLDKFNSEAEHFAWFEQKNKYPSYGMTVYKDSGLEEAMATLAQSSRNNDDKVTKIIVMISFYDYKKGEKTKLLQRVR